MQDLVLFYPEGHQEHIQKGHPERPERIEVIREALEKNGWWHDFVLAHPSQPPMDLLQKVHTTAYLEKLENACSQGVNLDMDTYTTKASWELAMNAAGGAIAVAEKVWKREANRGFALTRPPGHHTSSSRAMGFCLLNNIAVASEYLLDKFGAKRLAIVDLDLHHGNGTQDIFYQRSDVFYISTHQSPLFPGTGRVTERGFGKGEGYTANFPLPPGSGNSAFQTIMDEIIFNILDHHMPEMVLVSFGFDTHWLDPLGHLQLPAAGYRDLIRKLVTWADDNIDGRIALFLEGGYDLDAGRSCATAVTSALLGKPFKDILGKSPQPEGNSWEAVYKEAKRIWQY